MNLVVVTDDMVSSLWVTCAECGFNQLVPDRWLPVDEKQFKGIICSACWAVHARAFRLQKMAESVRPLALEEMKPGTTPSLFGPANRQK